MADATYDAIIIGAGGLSDGICARDVLGVGSGGIKKNIALFSASG